MTTTALVALAGAATAEISVSGTARLGLQTTEGTAAVAAGDGALTAELITAVTAANGAAVTGLATGAGKTSAADLTALDNAIAASQILAANATTAAAKKTADLNTGSLEAIKAAATGTAAVAKTEDSTTAKNRVRIKFGPSGETDSGLEFGASIRADNAAGGNSGTSGSQYLSGSFGKISMGDQDGSTVTVGLGQSDVGGKSETSISASLGMELVTAAF